MTTRGHIGDKYLQAFWDLTDDWSLFDLTNSLEVDRSHVIEPAYPYRSGLGRMASNWVGASTSFDTFAEYEFPTPRRMMRWGCAVRFESITNFASLRAGPLHVIGQDSTNSDLGPVWNLLFSQSLDIYKAWGGAGGKWFIFDVYLESTGDDPPFSTSGIVDTYIDLGSRLWYGGMNDLPVNTACKRFSGIQIGFKGLNQTTPADFAIHVDECRVEVKGNLPMGASPTPRRHPWPVVIL